MPGPERVRRGNKTARHVSVPQIIIDAAKNSPTYTIPDIKKPPRPQNAWILYRAWALPILLERRPDLKGKPQSMLSKILGQQWADETQEIRSRFENEANYTKEQHALRYPGYIFRPQKKEEKERERALYKQRKAHEKEAEKLRKEIAKTMISRNHVTTYFSESAFSSGTIFKTMESIPTQVFSPSSSRIELGPSPPMSLCPSLCTSPASSSDGSLEDVPVYPTPLTFVFTKENMAPPIPTPSTSSSTLQSEGTSSLNSNQLAISSSNVPQQQVENPATVPIPPDLQYSTQNVPQNANDPVAEYFSLEIPAPTIGSFDAQDETIQTVAAFTDNGPSSGGYLGLGNTPGNPVDIFPGFHSKPVTSFASTSMIQQPAAQHIPGLDTHHVEMNMSVPLVSNIDHLTPFTNNVVALSSSTMKNVNTVNGLPSPPDSTTSISPTEGVYNNFGVTFGGPSQISTGPSGTLGLDINPLGCPWDYGFDNFAYNTTMGFGDSLLLLDDESAGTSSNVPQPITPVSAGPWSGPGNYIGQSSVSPHAPINNNVIRGQETFWY